jgi:hypothetical protein
MVPEAGRQNNNNLITKELTMKINRQELLMALETVKPGLANREMIEQSTQFAFMGNRVVTYNDEISISHPVTGIELTGAIPADPLYHLLSKAKKEEIEITMTSSEIQFGMGAEKAGLPLATEIKLPLDELGTPGKWKPIPENFVEALLFCIFSCSRDMSKPVLTCIHVHNEGRIESSDNHRITRYWTDPIPVKTFLLPATSAQHVLKPDIVEIAEGKGWIHLKTKQGTVYSCRVFAENYPETGDFFKVEGTEIKLPKSLPEILERAEVFAKQEFLLDQKTEITLENNKMKIRTEGPQGWYEGEMNMKYKEDPITISIHPKFLREVIGKVQTCILGERVMKFEGTNWEHVVSMSVASK